MNEEVWVIIPAYNEENKIKEVINKVKNYATNIVVVDDGSKDNTVNAAKETGIKVLRHIVNLGKGSALKTGCEFALSKGAKIFIAIDADGQHDPDEIPDFLEALKENDIVFGYRKLAKEMPFILRFGNLLISRTISLFFGIILLSTYYLAYPPFPGLAFDLPVEGSYWIVNKNLVEIAALLVLYLFPSSHITGIDMYLTRKKISPE